MLLWILTLASLRPDALGWPRTCSAWAVSPLPIISLLNLGTSLVGSWLGSCLLRLHSLEDGPVQLARGCGCTA